MAFEKKTEEALARAAEAIKGARFLTAFSGAGISVESGIPPFRGAGGVWGKYDPELLDLDYFVRHPEKSWPAIKEMFTNFLATEGRTPIRPNRAHEVLAEWERAGRLKGTITQNIDGLHAAAGCRKLVEYHGHCRTMTCLGCGAVAPLTAEAVAAEVPRCGRCGGVWKPDFVFFGEGIPAAAAEQAEEWAERTDCMVLAGTSGLVWPAAGLPVTAKRRGATIVEVNPRASEYTEKGVTDVFVPLKAVEAFEELGRRVGAGA